MALLLFLFTPSARRATYGQCIYCGREAISIHALREEGDGSDPSSGGRMSISIHALREEGDQSERGAISSPRNFYPRPPRGGRLSDSRSQVYAADISIHALREEGDKLLHELLDKLMQFLSTPSARRATWCCRCRRCIHTYFYPRPPRGGRLLPAHGHTQHLVISIHALREEGDPAAC